MELRGSVALVTGAGSGIGRAAALRLAAEGATVGVLTHASDEGLAVAQEIAEKGGRGIPITVDVSDVVKLGAAIEGFVSRAGRIDIVLANAGINGVWAPIDELQPDDWSHTVHTNLFGTYLTLHYVVPHLKKAGGGSIIVVSSINGTRVFSNTGATAYACTKAGQMVMVRMLALELAKHRIRVNAICPGAIDTEIEDNTRRRNVEREKEPAEYPRGTVPLTGGQPGSPEDVAELVLFLASKRSAHITGTPVWIDGGQSQLQG
ncbi:SDR family oxidoreductase [Uliginosibacterium sp. sgz301328]|uniref:SDR family oxidoreductase n=1 Tax=Uliginosibacterium sp. sgz301328 TaxID=3243764 RepID=UPI00359E1087